MKRWLTPGVCFVIAGYALTSAGETSAQVTAESTSARVAAGVTVEHTSAYDPTQRYAIFVPSAYDPAHRWPLVLIMDPRGKALVPMERMQESAEELGYILMSSYDTRSDEDATPNERAVAAMIEDAQDLFAIDSRRLYFVGLSGTARAAWTLGERFAPYTAGIVSFGAALPSEAQLVTLTLSGPPPFPFFGGAGDVDFNYEEVRDLDEDLFAFGFVHFVDFYPGPHAWPPAPVFARALEWLDVQAVRKGTQRRSEAELADLFDRGVQYATRLEEDGDVEAAYRVWQTLAESYAGLVDTDVARARMTALSGNRELQRARARIRSEIVEREAFDVKVRSFLREVRSKRRPPDVTVAKLRLDIAELERRRARIETPEGKAAARMLASLFTLTSFYEPRDFIVQRNFETANALLRLAAEIEPEDPDVLLGLARTYAQIGTRDEAISWLERAVAKGAIGAGLLDEDPLLEPLRGDERFEALRREYEPPAR